MIAALGGATGFIGKALAIKLRERGWDVKGISRGAFGLSDAEFTERFIDGSDAVINLAGAPVSGKWTPEYKQEILESRTGPTRRIVAGIGMAQRKPAVFISSSAVGIYDSQNTHTETSAAFGTSYLAGVCKAWEEEATKATTLTRTVILRTGVVLGRGGGALEKMNYPFSIGLGGRTGSGRQIVSFIHLADLTDAILLILENPTLDGIVNAVSPYPVTNAEFTSTLAKVMKQTSWMPTPAFVLKMMYGEGASVVLDGQRVLPEKLEQAGFRFRYPTIQNALVQVYR